MPIFRNTSGKLKKLNAQPLDKEKNLQQLLETNLQEVLDLQFLATEYATTFGGRIDTLAVDNGGAPVIIEYKRNRNVCSDHPLQDCSPAVGTPVVRWNSSAFFAPSTLAVSDAFMKPAIGCGQHSSVGMPVGPVYFAVSLSCLSCQ